MLENIFEQITDISLIDILYLIITILSVLKCAKKGFILSILSASKWLLAYVLTLFTFPKIKPYFEDYISNEYALDITLAISLFVIIIFVILMINKGLKNAIQFTGLGKLDSFFGFFFGFLRGYVIIVCVFTTINLFVNYKDWPIKTKESFTFSYIEKGSSYLIENFPNEKDYEDSKEKIKDI